MTALLIVYPASSKPADPADAAGDLGSLLGGADSLRSIVDGAVIETQPGSIVFHYGSIDAATADLAQVSTHPSVAHAIVVPQSSPRPAIRPVRLALLVWTAVYVLLNSLLIATAPLLGDAPLLVRTFVATVILVPIIVLKVIPFVNRRFVRWLAR